MFQPHGWTPPMQARPGGGPIGGQMGPRMMQPWFNGPPGPAPWCPPAGPMMGPRSFMPAHQQKPPPVMEQSEEQKLSALQQQAQQWQKEKEWKEYNEKLEKYNQHMEEQTKGQTYESVNEEEQKFNVQYDQWKKQYDEWREQNKNHPNQEQYHQYEAQWKEYEKQMEDKKADITQRKQFLTEKHKKTQVFEPAHPLKTTNYSIPFTHGIREPEQPSNPEKVGQLSTPFSHAGSICPKGPDPIGPRGPLLDGNPVIRPDGPPGPRQLHVCPRPDAPQGSGMFGPRQGIGPGVQMGARGQDFPSSNVPRGPRFDSPDVSMGGPRFDSPDVSMGGPRFDGPPRDLRIGPGDIHPPWDPLDRPPFDRPPLDRPPFDGPPFDGPPFDGSPFDRPPFDRPPFDRPPFDGPPFDGPPFDGPPFDGPPFDGPPFDRPPFDEPYFDDFDRPHGRPPGQYGNCFDGPPMWGNDMHGRGPIFDEPPFDWRPGNGPRFRQPFDGPRGLGPPHPFGPRGPMGGPGPIFPGPGMFPGHPAPIFQGPPETVQLPNNGQETEATTNITKSADDNNVIKDGEKSNPLNSEKLFKAFAGIKPEHEQMFQKKSYVFMPKKDKARQQGETKQQDKDNKYKIKDKFKENQDNKETSKEEEKQQGKEEPESKEALLKEVEDTIEKKKKELQEQEKLKKQKEENSEIVRKFRASQELKQKKLKKEDDEEDDEDDNKDKQNYNLPKTSSRDRAKDYWGASDSRFSRSHSSDRRDRVRNSRDREYDKLQDLDGDRNRERYRDRERERDIRERQKDLGLLQKEREIDKELEDIRQIRDRENRVNRDRNSEIDVKRDRERIYGRDYERSPDRDTAVKSSYSRIGDEYDDMWYQESYRSYRLDPYRDRRPALYDHTALSSSRTTFEDLLPVKATYEDLPAVKGEPEVIDYGHGKPARTLTVEEYFREEPIMGTQPLRDTEDLFRDPHAFSGYDGSVNSPQAERWHRKCSPIRGISQDPVLRRSPITENDLFSRRFRDDFTTERDLGDYSDQFKYQKKSFDENYIREEQYDHDYNGEQEYNRVRLYKDVSYSQPNTFETVALNTNESDSSTKLQSDNPFEPIDEEAIEPPMPIDDLLCSPGREKRPDKIVIILRGPPGAGKTYVSKLIRDKEMANGGSAPRILCLDDYFMVEQEKLEKNVETGRSEMRRVFVYEYEAEMERTYRASLLKAFKKNIDDGFFNFIIVDAVNDKVEHFEEFWKYAKSKGFQVYVGEIHTDVNTCERRNIHDRTGNEIRSIINGFEDVHKHYLMLDLRAILQDAAINEVEMEDFSEERDTTIKEECPLKQGENDEEGQWGYKKSRWELDTSEHQLEKLDGIMKVLKHENQRIEDYLELADDYDTRSSRPGKKRVRWADIESRQEQNKKRDMGFVIGHSAHDWEEMMDDNYADRALNRTKYI